ncbi:gastrula zinc finger protein XlCGF57.1 [Trichonephila clavipes]|nr:gastrula zinc finger protein XlCGF57.1 [Trichonephila clavipes]
MSDCSPPSDTPSGGEQEPTMVSVPVVGSTDNMATSWNNGLCSAEIMASDSVSYLHDADSTSGSIGACDDERMIVDGTLRSSLTVNAIVTQESGSQESENSEDHLSVVDNITAQNFLQESDLMNAASSALGHKKSPSSTDHDHNLLSLEQHSVTSSQDHMEMQSLLQEQQDLDGPVSNYHLDSSQTSELSVESTSHLDIGSNLPEVVPGDGVCLSPSSNSSASSLDLSSGVSISSNIGLPPVSTIIRSSAKGRFDVFCRPSNINLIMGIPQYLSNSNSFDVMTSMNNIQRLSSSPCDSLNNVSLASPMEVSSSRHNACTDIVMESVDVPLSSSLVCSSTPIGHAESRCIKANTVMSSLGPDIMEKDALSDITDSEHGFDLPSRTIPNFVGVVPLREIMHISTSPSQHLSPMAIEEMQKVAEISEQLQSGEGMEGPFSLHSSDESIARVMLSPHFSVENSIQHSDSFVDCISQRSQPTSISAIETNVIMSTSNIDSSPKFTAAEIKAIEQRLRTEHSHGPTMEDSMDESALDAEVIIPDCIETSQSSDIIYSDVHNVLSGDSEERKILKAHNVARSTIIEKNLLQQSQVIKNESTVITNAENLSSNKITAAKVSQTVNNSEIITIRMAGKVAISDGQRDTCVNTVNPSAVTASVIQQLLRAHSPPSKLRTTMQRIPKGVITSVMSTKGDSIIHQDILVPSSSPSAVSNDIKKEDGVDSVSKDSGLVDNSNSSKDKLDISEHSVISHRSKSPSSSDEKEVSLPNITTTVLPSLFSNLSASALASLQSSLSSALPLTSLPNISIGDSSAVISHLPSVSPTLSSPPLSPILLPSILSSTLRTVSSGGASTLLDSIVTSNCVTSTNSMYSGLLKTVGLVKQEPGSGPLPPFTVVHGLSPLVKRSNLIGANPTSAQIPVVTIKQEPGTSRASVSASEFNPSIILNASAALPGIASIHLPPAAAAVQLPVVVTSSVAISTSALTNPVPSQASTIAFAGSTPTSTVDSSAEKPSSDKKWNCLMCKNGSPCGLHPTQPRLTAPPQPVLSGDPAKPFQCTLCGKHLASKNVYQLHLRSHSGEKPFTCNLCGHHFSQKTSLTRHMRSHTGERPFPCDVCGKRFADKERIKIHMRTHTGEKPFACEVCGKRFSQKSTVKRHMSVHTGEKPFKCESCGKGFANRGNLNAHSKTHANT